MNVLIVFYYFWVIFSSSISDWNFSGLTVDKYYEYYGSTYIYRFNFRKSLPLDQSHNCSSSNCVITEFKIAGGDVCCCYGNLTPENVTILPEDHGLNFTYISTSPTGVTTYGRLVLQCADETTFSASAYGNVNVTVWLNAKQGCKGWKPDEDTINKSRFPWGGVFFIIFLVVVSLYFVIGIVVQVGVYHKRGIDILPLAPIILFFTLVKDGVLSLVSLMPIMKGKRGEYSTIGA